MGDKYDGFIHMHNKWIMKQLAEAYVNNVVRSHDILRTIVSNCDTMHLSPF